MPLYLADFHPGQTFTSPGHTVIESEVYQFAALTNDNNEVHTNAEFAKSTRYGQRIVHGMFGASLCLGLIARSGEVEGSAVALLGIDQWKFLAPVFIGDTLTCTTEILSVRPTSSGEYGVLERLLTLRKQTGEIVQQGRMDLLVLAAPLAPPLVE